MRRRRENHGVKGKEGVEQKKNYKDLQKGRAIDQSHWHASYNQCPVYHWSRIRVLSSRGSGMKNSGYTGDKVYPYNLAQITSN